MPIDATRPYDDDNLFARILRGEIPSTKVHEDEWAYAFEDINPQAEVAHAGGAQGTLRQLGRFQRAMPSAEEIAGFRPGSRRETARAKGLVEPGYRLMANVGAHGGQEVPHLHVHIFGGEPLGPMIAR